MVRNGKAELVLYPKTKEKSVSVVVLRADVTTNPADDLRTLMTVGEVIPARVAATGPVWALILKDVDDDEPVVPAPSLLTGGPPWLVEEAPDDVYLDEQPSVAPAVLPMPTLVVEPDVDEPETANEVAGTPARPSPALLDRNRTRPTPTPSPAPARNSQPESTRGLLLKIDGLTPELKALKQKHDELQTQILAGADEREQLRYLLDRSERRANKSEHDLKAARSRLRKAGNARSARAPVDDPRFADREQGFRYLVLTQWATRTLPSGQNERPLPDYLLGPSFLDSLDKLEGVEDKKVADVVFEIVTGRAPQIPSREVHHLRTGSGGSDPIRKREDGAICWHASLQVKTPSAPRIHY